MSDFFAWVTDLVLVPVHMYREVHEAVKEEEKEGKEKESGAPEHSKIESVLLLFSTIYTTYMLSEEHGYVPEEFMEYAKASYRKLVKILKMYKPARKRDAELIEFIKEKLEEARIVVEE